MKFARVTKSNSSNETYVNLDLVTTIVRIGELTYITFLKENDGVAVVETPEQMLELLK